jgi:ABC-type transport system substrate-binding protein
MKKLLVLLVILLMIASFLIGCSKATPTSAPTTPAVTTPTPTTPTPTKTPATAPAPQGELIYAVPTLGSESFSYSGPPDFVLTMIPYERLFRTNRNIQEPQGTYPLLAENYTKSADGLTYDIYLRHGIQWHEGWGELTADDVVFTFDQIRKPELQNVYVYIFNSPDQGGYISSYEAIDPYHVRFHLSAPYNMFLIDLTDIPMYIVCKKYIEQMGWDEANKHPIGTGPWEWVETVSGDHIKFQAFDKYWGKMPEFKYLTLKSVPDISTELMMLEAGEADMAILTPEQAPEALNAGLQLLEVPNERFVGIDFGGQILSTWETYDPTVPWVTHTDEPADSAWNQRALKVREAMCLSIDPQVIIDKIMKGYANPAVMQDYFNSSPDYLPEWKPYPYDPQKAKELLAEAGYSNGFTKPIQMLIPSLPVAGIDKKAIMMTVADDFEAIGLKVDRQVMDQNLIDDIWLWGRKDAWACQVTIAYGIIKPIWGASMSRASWCPMHFIAESPTFDKLITEYTHEQDPNKAREVEQQIGNYDYYNYIEHGLFYASELYFFGPKVKNASQIPLPYWQESEIIPFFSFEYVQRAQ